MQDSTTLKGAPVQTVPLTALDDDALTRMSAERLLSLSLEEMRAIQGYFRAAGREPSDAELETLAQTWSEHCKHKTFKGVINYIEKGRSSIVHRTYDDLLKETIIRATEELNSPLCLSVFQDNAGVIAFDDRWGIAFKVETHNHPSALEPYGGAGTGIGGVIRDILGVGLGAKPILNTDVFCVGEFSEPSQSEAGVLPPKRILDGVVAGVRDYGNRMGIPTANGAVWFHPGYAANPLVFCGTVGLLPRSKIHKKVSAGDLIVAIGGRTGRDGIHGATFSSLALEHGISASVVQIGNAIVEKKVTDAILRAREANLYHAITDCGAGGFSSAIGELGAEGGARVSLEKAPLKYQGLAPWEIWLSESQERMVLAVPPRHLKAFQKICEVEDAECSVLGEFTEDGRLIVLHGDQSVCDLEMEFLHHGIPRVRAQAIWNEPAEQEQEPAEVKMKDCDEILKKLLAHPNIGSKRWIVRQYDHEVQGGSVIKPFVGDFEGPSDACLTRPLLDSWRGIAVANGINPLLGEQDPYWMAANAIDEALRNLVAVGGSIDHCAILDNFCWGDANDREVLGGLVRCAQGCYDFSKGFGVPFISGKDSLNNTWRNQSGKIASIPGTLLISAVGVVEDVRRCVTMDLKRPGNVLALIGETFEEFAGSHFNRVTGVAGGRTPKVNVDLAARAMRRLHQAIQKGWIRACHDLSEGGLAVAAAEMCLAADLGAALDLEPLLRPGAALGSEGVALFSETPSRWLVEIEPDQAEAAAKHFEGIFFAVIGTVEKEPALKVHSGKEGFKSRVADLRKAWLAFSETQ